MNGLRDGWAWEWTDRCDAICFYFIYLLWGRGVQKWKCTGMQMGFDKEGGGGLGGWLSYVCMMIKQKSSSVSFRGLCYFYLLALFFFFFFGRFLENLSWGIIAVVLRDRW